MKIDCPWCGSRSEDEFTCGGQSHIARPADPAAVCESNGRIIFTSAAIPGGLNFERWRHTYGCRQWFNVARHTVSHEVLAVYRMGEPKPLIAGGDA